MIKVFYTEFTADDRISFEMRWRDNRISGLRIKYQISKKTGRIITDIKGFEPFSEREWVAVVKYDNYKGEAIRDAISPTPVTFSPFGLHVKENWGYLNYLELLDKVSQDLPKNWQKDRKNYDQNLPLLEERTVKIAEKNIPRCFVFAKTILTNLELLKNLEEGQTVMPIPKELEDDWLLEENINESNRIDKKALRGELVMREIAGIRYLTHTKSPLSAELVSKSI